MGMSAPKESAPTHGHARRRMFAGVSVCLGLSIGLIIADLVQWLWLPCPLPSLPRAANLTYEMHVTGVETPGLSGTTRFTTESHGLRCRTEVVTPKPAGLYRIICVGGSTTECAYLDDKDAWPALIEEGLSRRFPARRFQVAGAGVSGTTSADHVTQVSRDLLRLEPDCIILMCGLNDHFRRGGVQAASFAGIEAWFVSHSMTVRRIERVRLRLAEGPPSGLQPIVQDEAGRYYAEMRRQCAATPVADSDEAFDALHDPLPDFARNLERIADACDAAGVRLVLVTHPNIYRLDLGKEEQRLLWMTALIKVDGRQPPLGWHMRNLSLFNRTIGVLGASRHLLTIDAAKNLPKDTSVFYDDCHFNISGSRLLADLITPELISILSDS